MSSKKRTTGSGYYALEYDQDFGVPATLSESDPGSDLKYVQGQKLSRADSPVDLRLESDEALDVYPDFFNTLRAPAASDRFVKAFRQAGVDNVQWFPSSIHTPDRVIRGYSVMNLVGRVACIDAKKSEVTMFRRQIARINSLALDTKKTKGAKAFRLHEYPELILVSEEVRPFLEDLSGLVLMPADGWSDEHRF
jgi:hypothetical protein